MHGNRETSGASAPQAVTDRREKAKCRTARTHAPEESDRGVIPMNRSNNPAQAEAVSEEGRPRIKENVSPTYTLPTQCGKRVSQGLAGVRKVAKERKKERFTAPLHHLTEELLRHPTLASATCRTGNLHGELLSVHKISQAYPGAPETRRMRGKIVDSRTQFLDPSLKS
jgi:hypothetical protein